MDKDGLEAFREHLNGVSVFLEYGCGGSTVLAARSGVRTIVSVDSDPEWAEAAQAAAARDGVDVVVRHADIGPTSEWGHPAPGADFRTFYRYPVEPWKYAMEHGIVPQLVLVDGRFRVASFLFSLLAARTGISILFDDYAERPQYHVVERFCPLVEMRGRMAVFTSTRFYSLVDLTEQLLRHATIPD